MWTHAVARAAGANLEDRRGFFSSSALNQVPSVCVREYAGRGRRWIDRKAAGEAVSDRAITIQPPGLRPS